MDTITYAAVAVLPWSLAQQNKHPVIPEAEFTLRQSGDGNPAGGELFTGSQCLTLTWEK
jgi:hypothetical protein